MTPRRILIVEDEPDMAATCVRLVERMGHRPLVATTGTQGLAVLEREALDLVVTDLRLPGLDGVALARRAGAGPRPVPAIVMTAYVSAASRRAAREAGAAFLGKPFSLAELRSAIERALPAEVPEAGEPHGTASPDPAPALQEGR
jgi:CheY-like chemotaxis protein